MECRATGDGIATALQRLMTYIYRSDRERVKNFLDASFNARIHDEADIEADICTDNEVGVNNKIDPGFNDSLEDSDSENFPAEESLHIEIETLMLLLQKTCITDLSERKFKNITAFQYALWAWDTDLCADILSCIPDTIAGEKIRHELRLQFEELEAFGVEYELNGSLFHECHFSIVPLLTSLHHYLIKSANLTYHDDIRVVLHKPWLDVGIEQRALPASLVKIYCNEGALYTRCLFEEQPFPIPSDRMKFIVEKKSQKESINWFPLNGMLGGEGAIVRSGSNHAHFASTWSCVNGLEIEPVFLDHRIFGAYLELKSKALIDIAAQLDSILKIEPYHYTPIADPTAMLNICNDEHTKMKLTSISMFASSDKVMSDNNKIEPKPNRCVIS